MGRRLSGMPFAASALLVAGALGACQSEESPPGSLSPSAASTSAAPSASASATPSASSSSDIPAAAREKSDKGAEAFVRYFFARFNSAWTNPSPGLIASLSHSDCEFCATTEKAAQALSDANQRYESDPLKLVSIEPLSGAPQNESYFFVSLRQNRANIVNASGEVVASDAKKSLPSNVAVRWSAAGWKMFAVEEVQ